MKRTNIHTTNYKIEQNYNSRSRIVLLSAKHNHINYKSAIDIKKRQDSKDFSQTNIHE